MFSPLDDFPPDVTTLNRYLLKIIIISQCMKIGMINLVTILIQLPCLNRVGAEIVNHLQDALCGSLNLARH